MSRRLEVSEREIVYIRFDIDFECNALHIC
jgi:hypothetical protein